MATWAESDNKDIINPSFHWLMNAAWDTRRWSANLQAEPSRLDQNRRGSLNHSMMNLIEANIKDTYALRQIPEKFRNHWNHLLRKKKIRQTVCKGN